MLKAPSTSSVKGFLFSDTTILVGSAIFFTPIVLTFAARFQLQSVSPIIYLLLVTVILFILSNVFTGKVKAVILGAALGVFFSVLLSVPFIANLGGQLSRISEPSG